MEQTVLVNGIKKEIPVKTILDEERIDEIITPEMIEFYVKDKPSWHEYSTNRDGIRVWQFDNNKEWVQITIPFNRNFSDYKYALYRCIKNLSFVEKNDEIDVFKNIVNNWNSKLF